MKFKKAIKVVSEKRAVHYANVQEFANAENGKWIPVWGEGTAPKWYVSGTEIFKRIKHPAAGVVFFAQKSIAEKALRTVPNDFTALMGTPSEHVEKIGGKWYLKLRNIDVIVAAKNILSQNSFVTTLEVKKELRALGFFATQEDASHALMNFGASEGLSYNDNGTYREYYIK